MRMRTAIRKHNWEPVDIPFKLDEVSANSYMYGRFVDGEAREKYKLITEWCVSIAGDNNVMFTMQDGTGFHRSIRIAFKHKKHATLCKLKWL